MSTKNGIKIMSIVGARPNFMKAASIAKAVESFNGSSKGLTIRHLIIHTGQHYDDQMSKVFFNDLGLPKPHVNLGVGSASHALQTAEIMKRFEPALMKHRPDAIILVGDVNSTIACALVASKIQYGCSTQNSKLTTHNLGVSRPLIAHVEAGLRSFDRTMPEEINRVLTDALSGLLFVTERDAIRNLKKEGISPAKIHFVGNVMIDTLLMNIKKAKGLAANRDFSNQIKGGYGLVTLHRPSNVDEPHMLSALMGSLKVISSRVPLIFPIHPRTRKNLSRLKAFKSLSSNNGIILTEPLGYLEFLDLLRSARLVLTDSGGIQEETTLLGVPCLTMRENTERPVTMTMGTNYLVGTDPKKILRTAFSVLDGKGKKGRIPPLWDGKAGTRIIKILVDKLITSC